MSKTILLLAANPDDTDRLRLDREAREIQNGLQRSAYRHDFIIKQQWAVRPTDVRRALLDLNPSIIHYCGHGEGEDGIVFENDYGESSLVSTEALAELFKLFAENIECVVLNACYSEIQAEAIAKHIDYVIGMNQAIGDEAATEFAVAFYDALGARRNIEFAYKLGCNAIHTAGIVDEYLTPVLKKKSIQPTTSIKKTLKNSQYDIFISYALSNHNWATTLINNLKVLLNRNVINKSIYLTNNFIERQQILKNSKFFFIILSSAYLDDENCRQELFNILDIVEYKNLVILEYEQVYKKQQYNNALEVLQLNSFQSYKFWETNNLGNLYTLADPVLKVEEFQYYQRLNELIQFFTLIKDDNLAQDIVSKNQTVIFLAEVSDDLQEQRSAIKFYLEQHNIKVLPEDLYFFPNAKELEQAIDNDLKQADLFVQLLSPSNPLRPAGMSTPKLQHERYLLQNLEILQWIASDFNSDILDLSKVIKIDFEEFKQYIIEQIEIIINNHKNKKDKKDKKITFDNSLVFINTALEDENLANEISEVLGQNNVASSLPILEQISPTEKRQDLEANLLDCDAVIIVYDNSSIVWVREQLRYCRRLQGRRKQPLKIISVFNKLSDNKPLVHMNLPKLLILDFLNLTDKNVLSTFMDALQNFSHKL
jgi:hypothetical protein